MIWCWYILLVMISRQLKHPQMSYCDWIEWSTRDESDPCCPWNSCTSVRQWSSTRWWWSSDLGLRGTRTWHSPGLGMTRSVVIETVRIQWIWALFSSGGMKVNPTVMDPTLKNPTVMNPAVMKGLSGYRKRNNNRKGWTEPTILHRFRQVVIDSKQFPWRHYNQANLMIMLLLKHR